METKKISEIAKLKIQNCNLSLQVLQLQANKIVAERDKVLLSEFKRLKYKPEEWQLNDQTWELCKIEKTTKIQSEVKKDGIN